MEKELNLRGNENFLSYGSFCALLKALHLQIAFVLIEPKGLHWYTY
jgi:hypothetical protein